MENSVGQLGLDVREPLGDQPDEMPPVVVELGGDAEQLFAHLGSYTCALLSRNCPDAPRPAGADEASGQAEPW